MRFNLSNINLKLKLFVFVALAIVLVLTMVATGVHYYADIAAANAKKERLNHIALSLQRLRLVEKAFQQQQSDELMKSFKELSAQLSNDIDLFHTASDDRLKKAIAELAATFQKYLSGFDNHAVICAAHDQKETLLVKPLNDANDKLANIIQTIEEKQSLLQMEGQSLSQDELEMLNVVRDCKIGILTLQVIQYQYIQTGDSAYLEKFNALSKGYVGQSVLSLETFAGALNNDAISKHAAVVKQSMGAFLSQLKEVQKLRADILDQRSALDRLGDHMLEQIDTLVDHNTTAIASVKKSAIGALTAVVIAGIVVFILVSLLLVRLITRPLKQVLEGLQSIAEGEGDLTRRLEIRSNDEIGLLARSFNAFIENLQAMIRNVSDNVTSIRNASGELTEIAGFMAEGSEQTTDKAKSVASASEEMSTNMVSVASTMQETSGNVNLVASATEEMTVTINAIAQNTEKARDTTRQAVDQASDASNQVAELGQAANEIGNVVETITEISEQVNLLALNATIEAARAGDAGKGFAVVANEIKELARQTASATLQIKQRVDGIQQSTDGTVSQIGSISRIVNDVNEIVSIIASSVEEQSVTTKEIAGNIVQVSGGIGTANDKVSHSSTVSQSISREIAEVTRAASEMSSSSSQINMSAEVLADRAHQLESMITRFKI